MKWGFDHIRSVVYWLANVLLRFHSPLLDPRKLGNYSSRILFWKETHKKLNGNLWIVGWLGGEGEVATGACKYQLQLNLDNTNGKCIPYLNIFKYLVWSWSYCYVLWVRALVLVWYKSGACMPIYMWSYFCVHVNTVIRPPPCFFKFPKMPCSFMLHFDRLTNVRKGVVLKYRHLAPEFPGARYFLPGDMKGGQVGYPWKGPSKCSLGMLISGR